MNRSAFGACGSCEIFAMLMLSCPLRSGISVELGKGVGRNMSPQGRGLSLEMSNPLGQHGTDREQESTERGVEGISSGYFAAVLKAPWPINRLFEFPPRRACHVSIREGLFLLPVRLLAAGGSHTSHLAVLCCLVPGRLSCICVLVCACVYECVCAGAKVHGEFHVFGLLISLR